MGFPGDGHIVPQMIQGIVYGRRFIVRDDHIDDPLCGIGIWRITFHIIMGAVKG